MLGFPVDPCLDRLNSSNSNIVGFVYNSNMAALDLIQKEAKRQKRSIELIPSENYVSASVLAAVGSVFTNKYSEGRPGNRYYGGNMVVDELELKCEDLALKLFGLDTSKWHVNVQPYSGSPANLAVYLALAEVGDTVMGLSLVGGGHLTHGAKPSSSGKLFHAVQYGVNADGLIDYDEIESLAKKAKPKLLWCGTTSYARTLDFKRFREIADKVGAYLVADISHIAGLVAGGVHPSSFSYVDVVTTTTHKTLRGPRGAMIFCKSDLAEEIDKAVFPTLQGGPHNNTTIAIAVALEEALKPEFRQYTEQIVKNAKALAEAVIKLGYRVVTGGTDNHLFMIDLTSKNLGGTKVTGAVTQTACEQADITLSRTVVPGYPDVSWKDGNGVRVGTPAITTRGMKEADMKTVAELFDQVVSAVASGKTAVSGVGAEKLAEVKVKVNMFASKFPCPGVDETLGTLA